MIIQLQFHCVLSLILCCFSYRLSFDFMTEDDMKIYFNVKTIEEVPEYDIVNPTAYSGHSRTKRNLESDDSIKYIKLEAFGEEFHMRLEENHKLLANGLQIDKHYENGTIETTPMTSRRCFYHGKLVSHNVSRIAVSTCKGMMGMIALENHNLYIRPLNAKHRNAYRRRRRDVENPHIIYKRNVDETEHPPLMPDSHFCGLDPEYADSNIYRDTMQNKLSEMTDQIEPISDDDINMNNSSSDRRKRQIGDTKYLEMRVVADRDMAQYYGDGVVDYVVTLMNVVAARYRESSLGLEVVVHIVKLDVLYSDEVTENGVTLKVVTDGRRTLNSWSNYQFYTNPYDDDHPGHWDNAMLITRKELMSSGSNSLLGIAWLSGTCYPALQAGLAQDAGLSTGQVIAHEIGHTLGMPHDGTLGCPDKVNVMSSSRPNGPDSFKWSYCSSSYFNAFLRSPYKQCLNDRPAPGTDHSVNAQDRPGSRVNFIPDEQCRRLWDGFGGYCLPPDSKLEDICANLHCERASDSACYSIVPAAEGTYCSPGKWCVSGQCVTNNGQGPDPVDGGWSSWGEWSACSRTCGGGVITRRRLCNNPLTQNGGVLCAGSDLEHELCNRDDCTTAQPNFAHEQCADTNNEPWNDQYYTWTAYFTQLRDDGLCAFRCLANSNFVISRGTKFADGTRCSHDGKNELLKCVEGQCVEFGCDGSIDSLQRYDRCGVCGGDESSCTKYSGTYSGGSQSTFTTFVDIPIGATSVDITNNNNRYSFTAVLLTNTNNYIFGEIDRGQSNEYNYQGTIVKYTSGSDSETIYIDGPTTVALSVQVYLLYNPEASSIYRPQISYEYYVPGSNQVPPTQPSSNSNYYWVKSEGSCSVTCGTGFMHSVLICYSRISNTPVESSLCDEGSRPEVTQPSCTGPPCPVRATWEVQPGQCSTTCGKGVGTERVICSTESGQVDDSNCDQSLKPTPKQEPCQDAECPSFWLPFAFGPCSSSCGTGIQTRLVWCVRSNGVNLASLDDNDCSHTPKPSSTQECSNSTPCPNQGVWVVLSSECSATCGDGVVTSYVTCRPSQSSDQQLPDSQCPLPKPPSQSPCNLQECIEGIWVISEFSQCSVSCGHGIRTRLVVCQPSTSSQQILPDEHCPGARPHTGEVCIQQDCPHPVWLPSEFSECSATCGGGTRTRSVTCQDENTQEQLPISYCRGNRPSTSEECNQQPCVVYAWFALNSYGPCSVSCGIGTQSQLVWCVDKSSAQNFFQVSESHCSAIEEKPEGTTRVCDLQPCPRERTGTWFTTQYSECSQTCGLGVRVRDVYCNSKEDATRLPETQCNPDTEPAKEQLCNNGNCIGATLTDSDGQDK